MDTQGDRQKRVSLSKTSRFELLKTGRLADTRVERMAFRGTLRAIETTRSKGGEWRTQSRSREDRAKMSRPGTAVKMSPRREEEQVLLRASS